MFGLSGGSIAVFNFNSTIVVQMDATVAGGAAALPTILWQGLTGEKNNLALIPPPCPVQFGPSGVATTAVNRILFTESNALIPPTSLCTCQSGASWYPSLEACITPVTQPRCQSPELFCPRLDRCVTQQQYDLECLFQKPTPPPP